MVHEKLLYFIWQHQYFNISGCTTIQNEKVKILIPGTINTNQGPDFLNASIQIGDTTWVGNIEIHVKSSDWILHGHQDDARYKNVIAHVVYEHDRDIGMNIPTIELKNIIANSLLNRYEDMMQAQTTIACAKLLAQEKVNPLVLLNWEDRLVWERFEQKALLVEEKLVETENHWEEVFWQGLVRYFGSVVNRDVFEEIAEQISFKLVAKHKHHPLQIEAMLFGQAGLLDDIKDDDEYTDQLKKEYQFLKVKYQLKPCFQKVQFLRLRPQNFPTIRLAQLTNLVVHHEHLFSKILNGKNLQDYYQIFSVEVEGYWSTHYTFSKPSKKNSTKKMSKSFINLLIINVVVPILFAYGNIKDDESQKEKAIQILETLAAEQNHITKIFTELEIEIKTAAQSQSYIQLYQHYCKQKKCLQCAIGNYFLGK